MNLTNEDLNAIKNIVKEETKIIKEDIKGIKEDIKGVKEDIKGIKEDIKGVKEEVKIVREEVEEETNRIVTITIKEFGKVNNRLDQHDEEFKKLHKEILSQDFKISENVHKSDFLELAQRVTFIETNLGGIK